MQVCVHAKDSEGQRQLCNVNQIEYFCNISCKYSTSSIRHVSDIDGCSAQKETYYYYYSVSCIMHCSCDVNCYDLMMHVSLLKRLLYVQLSH